MTAMRWVLGGLAALFAFGWVALLAAADGFRRSFGASENAWWTAVVPVAVALLALASVIWPERRVLLHGVAVLMGALVVASLVVARETLFVASLGLLYAGAWLLFYYHAVWKAAPPGLP